MQIHLSTEPPDLPKHKCLALGIFSDEKPPRGICGFIDWRLNGLISHQIKQGKIGGKFAEKVIFPFPPRIGSEILMLFGLGNRATANYDKIQTAAYQIISAIDNMLLNSFAFDLLGENRISMDTAEIAQAMVTGFFDYLSKDEEKLTKITPCMITSAGHLKEVSIGIKNFQTKVRNISTVKIVT
jgi:hypothetical protein